MFRPIFIFIICLTLPTSQGFAEASLSLTCKESKRVSDGVSYWQFSVKNISKLPVTIALDDKHFYSAHRDQNYPIVSAEISDFRGNPSSAERSFEILFDKSSIQGLILNPGDSLPITDLSFHFLPVSITAKLGVHDTTWEAVSVKWQKKTEQDAAANP